MVTGRAVMEKFQVVMERFNVVTENLRVVTETWNKAIPIYSQTVMLVPKQLSYQFQWYVMFLSDLCICNSIIEGNDEATKFYTGLAS